MRSVEIKQLREQATQELDKGKYETATNIARRIEELGDRHAIQNAAGIYIDAGIYMHDVEQVQKGISMLESCIEESEMEKELRQAIYYNAANGYYGLFVITKIENRHAGYFEDTVLDTAKKYYLEALASPVGDNLLKSQIFVNLGNCYDSLGRVLDGLECYEEALRLKPDHGMALGNMGKALQYYANVLGEHRGTFLREAYSLLCKALDTDIPPQARTSFSIAQDRIKNLFPEKVLDRPIEYPGIEFVADSDMEEALISFCIRNKIYLNICNYCQKCSAAIGDPLSIRSMIVPIAGEGRDLLKDDPFLRLSSYINQMKQDFITARFLLFLSRYKDSDLGFVDKRVRIINTLDYSIHNIHIELVKASFALFYGILDKVAFFMNGYLSLKIKETDVDFMSIWFMDKRSTAIREEMKNLNNYPLNAMYDIHKDLKPELRDIRNALTHRFLNIKLFNVDNDQSSMSEEEIVDKTLFLARIVRNAIIYLIAFVQTEEAKKKRKNKDFMPTLFAEDLPDNLKGT